jgi:hypothetical protein
MQCINLCYDLHFLKAFQNSISDVKGKRLVSALLDTNAI